MFQKEGGARMIQGCGKKFMKRGFIILSIKCGDWDLEKRKIVYCDECSEKNDSGKVQE